MILESSSQVMTLIENLMSVLRICGYQVSKDSLATSLAHDDSDPISVLVRECLNRGYKVRYISGLDESSIENALQLGGAVVLVSQAGGELRSESYSSDKNLSSWKRVGFEKRVSLEEKQISSEELSRLDFDAYILIEDASHISSVRQEKVSKTTFSHWLVSEFRVLRPLYRDVIVATALVNIFALASPLFVMNVYDRVVPNQAVETLWVLASGMFLVVFFDLIIKNLRYRFIEKASQHLDITLSSKLFAKAINLKRSSYSASIGELVSQLKDFDLIKQFLTAASITVMVDLPFMLLFLLIIYVIGGAIVIVPVLAGVVLLFYSVVTHLSMKKSVQKLASSSAEKTSALVESLHAIEMIQTFNAEGRQKKIWEHAVVEMACASREVKQRSGAVGIFSSSVIQLSVVFVVICGVYQLESQSMSLGALIAAVLLTTRALAPMAQIANLILQYFHAKGAKQALDALCDTPDDYDYGKTPILLRNNALDIEFKEVNVVYSGGIRALDGISIRISQGEKVGIIGKIGSGKSTLMRTVLGFCDNDAGSVSIGGIDIKHLDKKELRGRIGYVPQDISMLRGSLRDNLLLNGKVVEEDYLMKCVDVAGLREFVQNHPKGLDLQVGENGQGLSGGQKQCLAIARALIGKPELLLFDELTSAMDNQTEQMIIKQISAFSEDKTLLLSTHRASLLSMVDRIIVMDEGKVIADGEKKVVLDALKQGLIKTGEHKASVSGAK